MSVPRKLHHSGPRPQLGSMNDEEFDRYNELVGQAGTGIDDNDFDPDDF